MRWHCEPNATVLGAIGEHINKMGARGALVPADAGQVMSRDGVGMGS